MMRRLGGGILSVVLAGAALVATAPARAESATQSPAWPPHIVILGIIEDADPVGYSVDWISACEVAGYSYDSGRDDGRPDISIDPGTKAPFVVWSWGAGSRRDIAWNEWLGDRWGTTTLVAATPVNELDPRGFAAPRGVRAVTWWQDGSARGVWFSQRNGTAAVWSAPRRVHRDGRRPSILLAGDQVHVAFERDASGGQSIVLGRSLSVTTFSFETVAWTPRQLPLDVEVHRESDLLWVDWHEAPGLWSWSVRGSAGWSNVRTVSHPDASWIDDRLARELIRDIVLRR